MRICQRQMQGRDRQFHDQATQHGRRRNADGDQACQAAEATDEDQKGQQPGGGPGSLDDRHHAPEVEADGEQQAREIAEMAIRRDTGIGHAQHPQAEPDAR